MALPYCRTEPVGDFQFAFSMGGTEVTRWCFSPLIPRPYFFPVRGPSGQDLTRMGHPGAPNHDHHRSLWFSHNDLMGQDFWAENKSPRIAQSQWYAIEDHDEFTRLACELRWTDGHDPQPLARQDLFITVRPIGKESRQWTLELQSDFRAGGEGVAFRKNNFGILGLRVAKSLSVVFGEGSITGSDGNKNEKPLFGQPNRWIDYSGPVGHGDQTAIEGLTLIDHKLNPSHPAKWHVRDDGWMGPSLSRDADVPLDPSQPLTVRYLLFVHSGPVTPEQVGLLADEFDSRPVLRIVKGSKAHHQWEIV